MTLQNGHAIWEMIMSSQVILWWLREEEPRVVSKGWIVKLAEHCGADKMQIGG